MKKDFDGYIVIDGEGSYWYSCKYKHQAHEFINDIAGDMNLDNKVTENMIVRGFYLEKRK